MTPTLLAAAAALSLLTACGAGAAEQAALEAYDACKASGMNRDLLRHDGNEVRIEITGEDARDVSRAGDAAENLQRNQEWGDDDLAGVGTMFAALSISNCMVEETGYPGTSEQLADGESWEGWSYAEESGAGSEVLLTYTATD